MPNIRFIIDNISDESTLSATNPHADTKYEVDNIKRISRLKTFRSEDVDSTIISGTLSETKDVSAFVIARHNFSTQVTYRLQLYSNANWTGEVHDTGIVPVLDNQAATDLWEWGEFTWGNVVWGGDRLSEDTRANYNIVKWLDVDNPYTIQSFKLTIAPATVGGDIIYCNDQTVDCNQEDIDCNQIYFSGGGTP